MSATGVIEKAVSELNKANEKSRNNLLNKVRFGQIAELSAALVCITPESDLQVWESRHRYEMMLARSILDHLSPKWNQN